MTYAMHPQKAFIGQQYVRRFISSLHGESSFAPEKVLGQPEKGGGGSKVFKVIGTGE